RKLAALRAAIFSINIKKRRFSEIIMKIVAFIRSQNIYVPTPFHYLAATINFDLMRSALFE
ncbi:hypothetical protein ACP6J5_08320, partial [Staphylococcus simulans]|uniref:hypothetical protein n=1 Tax=Staphylococcus simulans TaxID=1286 RepID=UPI003F7DA78C